MTATRATGMSTTQRTTDTTPKNGTATRITMTSQTAPVTGTSVPNIDIMTTDKAIGA